jgi:uncharacterized delta-60 repeat protein
MLVGTADTTPPASPPGSVTELSVTRLEPDGTPDATFGDNGTVNVSVTGRDTGAAIALQPDGRIVVAGASGGLNSNFAIARLLADGTLDTDFTDTGVMTIDFFGFTDVAEAVAVTDEGRPVDRFIPNRNRVEPVRRTTSSYSSRVRTSEARATVVNFCHTPRFQLTTT